MRLVTFQNSDSARVGALVNGDVEVVDLSAVDPQIPPDMLGLLAGVTLTGTASLVVNALTRERPTA